MQIDNLGTKLTSNNRADEEIEHQLLSLIHIQMCIRDRKGTIDFGEDQLRERGSLPATFYVLTRVKYLILINKVS